MNSEASLILTIVGPDRPGLVGALAEVVAAHGGNWLESRMCRLGGEFAGILRVAVSTSRAAQLQEALRTLDQQGLTLVVRSQPAAAPEQPGQLATLEIVGQDRPGIVRQISQALASQRVNVENLESERTSAPMTGEQLFRANIELSIPTTCDIQALREKLEQIGEDLLVEIRIEVGNAGPARHT